VYIRQAVQLHGALHGHVAAQVGELDLDQLAGVQRAMPVPAHTRKTFTLQKQETSL